MNELTLTLTLDQINTILAGIGELPTRVGLPITEEIRKQVLPQIEAANANTRTESQFSTSALE